MWSTIDTLMGLYQNVKTVQKQSVQCQVVHIF